MYFPIVGALSAVLAALGIYGLMWYHGLSPAQREEADRLAAQYARDIYGKALDELTAQQARRVHDLVKGHFAA